ncbi:MAG: sulfite exporter TauE/SafE family protein [Acidimicrobiales bacterium]
MHVVGLALVAALLAVFVGAILQGCIGFGMVVLAFPVLVSLEPALLPGTVLLASIPLVTINLYRNWSGADFGEVAWLMSGRIPGMLAAVLLVRSVDRSVLAIGGGLVVLAAVALSLWAPSIQRNRATLVGAGAISGLFGTAVGIGGPPLGLLYQHETGPKLRSTVSVLMFVGAPLSAAILAISGELTAADLRTGLVFMPATTLGILSAPKFIPWVDTRLRVTVLVVCAIAALVAMARVAIVN